MNKLYLLILALTFGFYFSSAQKPVASFSPNDTIICSNNCIYFKDLSTNNPTSWKWSFQEGLPATSTEQNPIVCYLDTGSHDVTLIATNNSGSDTLTKNAVIIVNLSPPLPLITFHNPDTLFVSTDTSYISYQWYLDTALIPGATDSFLVIVGCNNYNVLVCNRQGCCVALGFNIVCGVHELTDEEATIIYPTLATNELTLRNSRLNNEMITISIMNVLGGIVQEEKLIWRDFEIINVNALPTGIYFLQMNSVRGSVVKRFVKG